MIFIFFFFLDVKTEKPSPINSPISKSNMLIDHRPNSTSNLSAASAILHAANTSGLSNPLQMILKCNNCDYFAENKLEIDAHFSTAHPNEDNDFIMLPNPMTAAAAANLIGFNIAKLSPHTQNDQTMKTIVKAEEESDNETDIMTIEPDLETVAAGAECADDTNDSTEELPTVMCPLCQDNFTEKSSLEIHLMTVHSVNKDGLTRLLLLVDTSIWDNKKEEIPKRNTSGGSETMSRSELEIECLICCKNFKTMSDLFTHCVEYNHYNQINDQFVCLLKSCPQLFANANQVQNHFKDTHLNIVISERHVYKYRCKLCSLAFKTQEKLNTHSLYHTMRDATKCNICNRNFRSTASLQKHMEQAHNTIGGSPCNIHGFDKNNEIEDERPHSVTSGQDDETRDDDHNDASDLVHQQLKAVQRRNEKLNSYPLEKYLDPNRPFKCEICRESFTQKNILLVHYNSVSHLHKQKKQSENNNTPSASPNNDVDRKSVEFDRKSIDYDDATIEAGQKRKLSPENDYDSPKKRFKCDICKVAYAQGSTLDIHMRSVLHQTRACRLQEEQQRQQRLGLSPNLTRPNDLSQGGNSISPTPSNLSQDDQPKPNQVFKTLLETYGFDLVKQFNEINKHGSENQEGKIIQKKKLTSFRIDLILIFYCRKRKTSIARYCQFQQSKRQ